MNNTFHNLDDKENQQICTFKKLEPANMTFFHEKLLKRLMIIRIVRSHNPPSEVM